MKIYMIVFAGVFMATFPVHAQDVMNDMVLQSYCDRAVEHTPDTNVEYIPGYDMERNAVEPADLDDGKMRQALQLPDTFMFNVTVDQAELLGLPATDYLDTEEGVVGTVTVSGNTISFNDKEISTLDPENLKVLCLSEKE